MAVRCVPSLLCASVLIPFLVSDSRLLFVSPHDRVPLHSDLCPTYGSSLLHPDATGHEVNIGERALFSETPIFVISIRLVTPTYHLFQAGIRDATG